MFQNRKHTMSVCWDKPVVTDTLALCSIVALVRPISQSSLECNYFPNSIHPFFFLVGGWRTRRRLLLSLTTQTKSSTMQLRFQILNQNLQINFILTPSFPECLSFTVYINNPDAHLLPSILIFLSINFPKILLKEQIGYIQFF